MPYVPPKLGTVVIILELDMYNTCWSGTLKMIFFLGSN